MFAPLVAKVQTKAVASSISKLAPRHSMLAARPFGGAVEQEHMLQRSVGSQATLGLLPQSSQKLSGTEPHGHNEQEAETANPIARGATLGVSWDFSKIPIFPPEGYESGEHDKQEVDRIPRDMRDGGAASDDIMLMDQDQRPVAVRNGPFHAPINTPTKVGMKIAITLTSSTGRDRDMASVQDSEQVSLSRDHTGSFSGIPPIPSNVSDFMAGFPIPNDEHDLPRRAIIDLADNHGGDGQYDKDQLDIFKAPAEGITTPTAIPDSGYQVRRSIRKGPGTKIVLRTEKSPHACTVNGFTTTPGPSPTYATEVVVRP